MHSYWRVLGRCCADPKFYEDVLLRVNTGYPDPPKDPESMWKAQPSDVPKNMYKFLAKDLRLRISLFEIWEILRFFSPDPKGPESTSLVDDSIRAIHQLIGNNPLDEPVYEILGICCLDRDFTKALVKEANAGHLKEFLDEQYYERNEPRGDLRNLTHLVTNPAFVTLMGAMTISVWDEPCDESISFNPKFNDRHPWGAPRAWFAGEVMSRVRRHLND